jgi:hypothetical protein
VTAESAGYFGYYGRVTLYDYPGLTSDHSLVAMRSVPLEKRNLVTLIAELQPDYLVLRPDEVVWLRDSYPEVALRYEVLKTFAAPGIEGQRGPFYLTESGLTYGNIDQVFVVLRRQFGDVGPP